MSSCLFTWGLLYVYKEIHLILVCQYITFMQFIVVLYLYCNVFSSRKSHTISVLTTLLLVLCYLTFPDRGTARYLAKFMVERSFYDTCKYLFVFYQKIINISYTFAHSLINFAGCLAAPMLVRPRIFIRLQR